MAEKKRKYKPEAGGSGRPFHDEWTSKFGVIKHNDKALCCLCQEIITARYYNINRHFVSNHNKLCSMKEEEKCEVIQREVKEHNYQSNRFQRIFKPRNNISAASFQLSNTIAQHGKPLSDGEYLKEAFKNCSEFLFEDFANKNDILRRINEMPAARNTVKDRIIAMDEDVTEQLLQDLRNAEMFSLCLDECTDVTSAARVAVIARYPSGNIMKEEMISLMTLSEKTRGHDIMNELKKKFMELGINFGNIVSVTTDGAPSMVGKNCEFVKLLRDDVKHDLVEFHCMIHQQALCAKNTFKSLEKVMSIVTKVVNFIVAHALNKRQFNMLLNEVDSQYSGLIMYNNVRWLSRGQVLNRFVELLEEIKCFLGEKGQEYPELTDINWLNDLHFFADFALHYNNLNTKLQGSGNVAPSMFGHIKAFEKKLVVFSRDLEENKLNYFPLLKKHFEKSGLTDSSEEKEITFSRYSSIIRDAKNLLSERFVQFRKLDTTLQFIFSPDTIQFKDMNLSQFDWLNLINLEMELIEFQESAVWKTKFFDMNQKLQKIESKSLSTEVIAENIILTEWNSLPSSFESMKKLALALLTLFGSSYSCESLFSHMNFIKSSTRNRLGANMSAACIKLKTTTYKPRILMLSDKMQQQVSH